MFYNLVLPADVSKTKVGEKRYRAEVGNILSWRLIMIFADRKLISWSQHTSILQYNLNGSNTDSSFTVDESNSFFSPYKIFPIAQENKEIIKEIKYLMIFSYFIWNCMLCVLIRIASSRRF